MVVAYRLPLQVGVDLLLHVCVSVLEVTEFLLDLLLSRLVLVVALPQVEVDPPVVGVKAPVAGPALRVVVGVPHELGRAEQAAALEALDAGRTHRRAGLGQQQALALAEALVLHLEAEGRVLGVEAALRGLAVVGPVDQAGDETLGVTAGDQAALVRAGRQHLAGLEHLQLLLAAGRAEDVHVVASGVNGGQGDLVQHRVQDLGQAEPGLPAHVEAGYQLSVEQGLAELGRAAVSGQEHWH